MVIEQSAAQRNLRIAVRALFTILGMACGVEACAIFHQQPPGVLTLDYSLMYATGFVLAFMFVWLIAKRNVKFSITPSSLEISHDEDVARFAWQDVKRVKQPTLLRRNWIFELKNTRRIKISTRYFSRKQIKQIKHYVSRLAANAPLSLAAAVQGGITHPRITHPRVVDPA